MTLHFAGDFVATQKMNKGLELPIEQIIATFVAEGFAIAMATATTTGVVFTVPGATTVALPQELVPALAGLPAGETYGCRWRHHGCPGCHCQRRICSRGLSSSSTPRGQGAGSITLWLRHGSELIALLESHRRVALVWHRCGGPALMQMFFRMSADHTLAMPQTINGRPLSEALCRIADALRAVREPRLRHDLAEARAALPDLGGMTYPQVLTAFRPE